MASSSLQSPVAELPEPGISGASARSAYIDAQVNQARRQVKLVDLATSATLLAAGVLVYFLLLVVIDHWLMPLGFWGRLASLTVLLGGAGWYIITHMLPLLVKQINPVYAARTIEESDGTLHNSLLNFLLFRKNPTALKEVVLRALEEQAATDLGHVEIDSAVDRTPLIRIGYVLAGVLAVCAVYTVLSPKNPFTTVRRVMLPFADIQKPARVLIDEVKPGDRQVYHGQTLGVTVTVRGVGSADPVYLYYSTADETTVDRRITMTPRDGTATYVAMLPATEGGIQQELTYRIVAGDAESARYHVSVLPSPTITVEDVQYVFPAYTARPAENAKRQGDLRALEGTRVTIQTLASQPIAEAYVEFDPVAETEGARSHVPPRWSTKVNVNGNRAMFSFTLGLLADRRTPAHTSYQLRFRTPEGNQNDQPILHSIEVLPDLPPELQIVEPNSTVVEVPLNRRLNFSARAIDPDFGLSSVKIKLAGGADRHLIQEQELLNAARKTSRQTTVNYTFLPKQLRLRVGDEVVVWFEVSDTRTLPSGTPEPSVTRSKNVRVTVLPEVEDSPQPDAPKPDPNQKPNPQNQPQENDPNNKPNDNQKGGEKPPEQPQDNAGNKGDQGAQQPQNSPPNNKPQNSPEKQQGGNNQQKNDETQGANSNDKQNGGAGGAAGKQNSGQPNAGEQQGDPSQTGGQPSPGGAKGQLPPNGTQGQGSEPSDNSAAGGSKQQGTPSGESKPLNSDGSQDADAIHEILQHQQQSQKGGQPTKGQADPQQGGQPGEKPEGAAGEKNKQPENKQGNKGEPKNGAQASTPGAQQSGEKSQGGQPKAGAKPGEQGPESKPGEAGEKPNATGAEKKTEIKDPNVPDRKSGDAAGPKENSPGGKSGEPKEKLEPGKEESNQNGGGEKKDQNGGQGDNGKSGGGLKGEESGSPESQGDNKQRRMEQKPDDRKGEEKGEAQSPSISKHQSTNQGDQRGEQSGGGGKGGGQGAKQEGNDSAGSTSAGDEGNGAAKEQGNGETGSKAGAQQKSDERTGQAGNEKGNGSNGRPKGEQQPGEKPKEGSPEGGEPGQGGASGEKNSPAGKTGAGTQSDGNTGDNAVGGNFKGEIPKGQRPPQDPATANEPSPEKQQAEVEYARKATDLALEYLKDQQDNPDPSLLKKLGWTKEQLQDFVSRWQQMKDAAGQNGDKGRDARDELDAALRSLGLRPAADTLRTGNERNDKLTGQRDTGGRTAPPAEYAEQYKAFLKGTARGEKKE